MEGDLLFSTDAELDEAREKVLALTGIDIAEGTMSAGSRNVTYVVSQSIRPSVVRISPASVKPHSTVLSELLFVDYLREHIRTVCNPVPFGNSLINTITVAGNEYYVVVSRKANGISPSENDFADPHLIELYGQKFGQLHAASRTAAEEGFHFQRPNWLDAPGFDFSREDAGGVIPADVKEIMIHIRDKVAELPQTPLTFGLIHGDASPCNSFLDWDDVWLFDFDDCCYHYFLYDCACFLVQAKRGIAAADARKAGEDGAAEQKPGDTGAVAQKAGAAFDPTETFFKGYVRENPLPDECLSEEHLERFMNLRIASGAWLLTQSRTEKGIADAKLYIPLICEHLRALEL